ncbi:threonine dehydrogenase-like Zn-dependent dehydrogenase/drug/metabolite transporter (DMT)-like permease [Bradyrhizobium yuanmingense]
MTPPPAAAARLDSIPMPVPEKKQQARRAPARVDHPFKGIALVLLSTIFLGCSDVTAKYLSTSLPSIEITWIRFVTFALLFTPVMLPGSPLHAMRTERLGLQLMRGAALLGSSLFFITGLAFLPIAEASATGFVSPLFVTALSIIFLSEKVGMRRWIATAIGLTGVLIILRPGTSAFHAAAFFPIISAFCWAAALILTRMMSGREAVLTTMAYSALTGVAILSVMVPFVWVTPSWTAIGLGIVIGVASTVGQWIIVLAYRYGDASVLAPFLLYAVALGQHSGLLHLRRGPGYLDGRRRRLHRRQRSLYRPSRAGAPRPAAGAGRAVPEPLTQVCTSCFVLSLAPKGRSRMRAAIFRNGEIVVGRMAEPTPGPGQVLVKTLACGICGSDLHARQHAHRMVEMARKTGRKPMDLSRDVVFGHEFCCEIVDYGPGTSRKLKPGTQVCSLPALVTPQGIEGIGYSNDNVGGYAEAMLLSEALLLEVPNGPAPEHAALTEPLAVGVHAVAKANIRGGEVPLVIGCGPVGLAVIAALKLKRLHPIVAADYSPARRALAAKLGADIVVDPRTSQPYATWAEHAQMSEAEKAARPPFQAMLPALKPAIIFECVGVPGLLQQVFEGAPRDARIVVVGVCMESDRSEPMLGIMKELNVQYVLGYTPEEFAASLRLIAEGQVDAAAMVTAEVGLDGVAKAFADLANPEAHTKIIVQPWR